MTCRFVIARSFAISSAYGSLCGGGFDRSGIERAAALVEQELDVLLLDLAHADSGVVARAVHELRARLPRVPLVVGNVATASAARFLIELGVDAIKVGIGPGRGCRCGSSVRRGRCRRSFTRRS